MFAIVTNHDAKHIGNIKIGPIHFHYRYADISYFIGEKKMWNRGIATEAIKLICDFGFQNLQLHKIEAGVYEDAVGSWKALEKAGFLREGILREHVLHKDHWRHVYKYGLIYTEYKK